jgi:hypothetical protein
MLRKVTKIVKTLANLSSVLGFCGVKGVKMDNFEDRNQASFAPDREFRQELARIETEIEIESSIDEAFLRVDLAEYENTRGIDYVTAFLDGWNTCIKSFIDLHNRSEMKYRQLELRHPEWFTEPVK